MGDAVQTRNAEPKRTPTLAKIAFAMQCLGFCALEYYFVANDLFADPAATLFWGGGLKMSLFLITAPLLVHVFLWRRLSTGMVVLGNAMLFAALWSYHLWLFWHSVDIQKTLERYDLSGSESLWPLSSKAQMLLVAAFADVSPLQFAFLNHFL